MRTYTITFKTGDSPLTVVAERLHLGDEAMFASFETDGRSVALVSVRDILHVTSQEMRYVL